MTLSAEPLMRAMWNEFPDTPDVYEINSQFMVGSGILFAPKVNKPSTILSSLQLQQINFYLPSSEVWYNYQTKIEEAVVGEWQSRTLSDLQQGLFVRGGTILPLLQHDDCMALLACITNAITLEIYIDADGNSYGQIYLDDGETFDFAKDATKSALIKFNYESNTLTSYFESGSGYDLPETQQVTKVIIYGLDSNPAIVLAANIESDYYYDVDRKALVTSGFSLKLGQGKMIELAWN